ncbi:MAG TPA: hypothetical protein VLJ59_10475 [Mycobacteriales bacterium]|nr:hypothetical protein [Mycobacteriales bacterium]
MGVYPKQQAGRYMVRVYSGDRKVDGKDQDYPPHGSVPPTRYKSGQTFFVTGTIDTGSVIQKFYIKCVLA